MKKGNIVFQRSVFECPHGSSAVGEGETKWSAKVTEVSYGENKTLCQFSGQKGNTSWLERIFQMKSFWDIGCLASSFGVCGSQRQDDHKRGWRGGCLPWWWREGGRYCQGRVGEETAQLEGLLTVGGLTSVHIRSPWTFFIPNPG